MKNTENTGFLSLLLVADPGFTVGGGANLIVGGGRRRLPMWLRFEKTCM